MVTSLRANSINPKPIKTRPTRPAVVSGRVTNKKTPTKINKGDNQDRSRENKTAMTLVPMSAPNITAKAGVRPTKPCPTNEETIKAVAVLDCTKAVTAKPESIAVKRFFIPTPKTDLNLLPNTCNMPLRTKCVPQTKRAIAANKLSKWVINLPFKNKNSRLSTIYYLSLSRKKAKEMLVIWVFLKRIENWVYFF